MSRSNMPILYALLTGAHKSNALSAAITTREAGHPVVAPDLDEYARRLGVGILTLRMPAIEYHTGALMGVGAEIEEAVAKGACVVILDEADAAAPGVLEAVARLMPARKEEGRALSVLAVVGSEESEANLTALLASALGKEPDQVLSHSLIERFEAKLR